MSYIGKRKILLAFLTVVLAICCFFAIQFLYVRADESGTASTISGTLSEDVTGSDLSYTADDVIYLDGNTITISSSVTVSDDATLKIYAGTEGSAGGYLSLSGGSLSGSFTISEDNGLVYMGGSSVTVEADADIYGTVSVNDFTVVSGELYISNTDSTVNSGYAIKAATLSVEGGASIMSGSDGDNDVYLVNSLGSAGTFSYKAGSFYTATGINVTPPDLVNYVLNLKTSSMVSGSDVDTVKEFSSVSKVYVDGTDYKIEISDTTKVKSSDTQRDILALAKIKMLTNMSVSPEDVISGKIEVEDSHIEDMLDYFEDFAQPRDGVIDQDNYTRLAGLERGFFGGLAQVPMTVINNMDAGSLENFRSLKSGYEDLFSDVHSHGQVEAVDPVSYSSLKTIETFGNLAARKSDKNGFAAGIVSAMCEPLVSDKSVGQVNAMYPVNNKGENYIDVLQSEVNVGLAFRMYGKTMQPDMTFTGQFSGPYPQVVRKEYQEAIQSAKERFADDGGILAEYNTPVPVVVDSTGLPDYRLAVSRIAMNAADSLRQFYTDNGSLSGDALDDVTETYGKTVENQLTRLLLESGYETKVANSYFKEDLAADIDSFSHSVLNNTLPYFFTRDMVDKATASALEELKDGNPFGKDTLEQFDPVINYIEDKTNPVTSDYINKITAQPRLRSIDTAPIVGLYNKFERGNNVNNYLSADTKEMLKNLSLNQRNSEGIAEAARLFDAYFLDNNEQYGDCIDQPDVAEFCGRYTGKDGIVRPDVTKLFYINSNSVETQLKSELGERAYGRLSEADKVDYAKAAMMKYVFTPGMDVYAKHYVQKEDNSVDVIVSSVIENDIIAYRERHAYDDEYDPEWTAYDERGLSEKNISEIKYLKADDAVAAKINSKISAERERIRNVARNRREKIIKNRQREKFIENAARLQREAQQKADTESLIRELSTPDEKLFSLQQELDGVIAGEESQPAVEELKFSPSDSVEDNTVASEIDHQSEGLIRNIDFNSAKDIEIATGANSFDTLISEKYPWIGESLKDPTVAETYKLEITSGNRSMSRGDATQLFYIDGEPVENYVKARMPAGRYDSFNPLVKEVYCKAAVMNALLSGEHAVDAKGYVLNDDGRCEVKVSNIEYGPAYSRMDYQDKVYNAEQAALRAERIAADDTVARRINEAVDASVNSRKQNVADSVNYIATVGGLGNETQERLIREADLKNLKAESLYPAANRFDELVLRNYPWLGESINNPVATDMYKIQGKNGSVRGDVTKLFYIDGKNVDEYLKDNMNGYNRYSSAEKEYIGKLAIMNALVNGKAVDAKGYVKKGHNQCGVKVCQILYDPVNSRLSDEQKIERNRQASARAAIIAEEDEVSKKINAEAAKTDREDTITAAKMYKMYTQGAQDVPSRDVLLATNTRVDKNDVGNMNEFMASATPEELAAYRDYFVNAAEDLKLDNIFDFNGAGDVRDNKYALNSLASTVTHLYRMGKSPNVAKAEGKTYGSLQNLYAATSVIKDMQSDDPVMAMAGSMAYRLFEPNLKGKTLGQVADMYPANQAGNTYFSVAAEEIRTMLKEDFPDLTAAEVKAYRDTGKLPDSARNIKLENMYNKAMDRVLERYYGSDNIVDNISEFIANRDHMIHNMDLGGIRINPDNSTEVRESDMPVALDFGNDYLPDYKKAISILAEKAKAAAVSMNDDPESGWVSKEVIDSFGRNFEAALNRELFKNDNFMNGYKSRCSQAVYKQDLVDDMEAFINGSNTLPYFFEKSAINNAINRARNEIKEAYDVDINSFRLNNYFDSNYKTEKPALMVYDTNTALSPVSKAVHVKEEIALANCYEMDRVDLNKITDKQILVSDENFEYLIGNNPDIRDSMRNADVAADCKNNITNLFYIDGVRADKYVSDHVKGYFFKSAEEKRILAEAAIVNAIYVDKTNVDVKCYYRNNDGTCVAKVIPVTDKVSAARQPISGKEAARRNAVTDSILKADKVEAKINEKVKADREKKHKTFISETKKFRENEKQEAKADATMFRNERKKAYDSLVADRKKEEARIAADRQTEPFRQAMENNDVKKKEGELYVRLRPGEAIDPKTTGPEDIIISGARPFVRFKKDEPSSEDLANLDIYVVMDSAEGLDSKDEDLVVHTADVTFVKYTKSREVGPINEFGNDLGEDLDDWMKDDDPLSDDESEMDYSAEVHKEAAATRTRASINLNDGTFTSRGEDNSREETNGERRRTPVSPQSPATRSSDVPKR